MPASRSGERLHSAGESSSAASGAVRTKATRVPVSKSQEGKFQGSSGATVTRRALGDVSNIDKVSLHRAGPYPNAHDADHYLPALHQNANGRSDGQAIHLKAGSHMRGEEPYKPKVVANQGLRREAKPRSGSAASSTSATSTTTTSTTGTASSQGTVRPTGAKRVRATGPPMQATVGPPAPKAVANGARRLNTAKPSLRHAASQPHSLAVSAASSAGAGSFGEGTTVRSKSNTGLDGTFGLLAPQSEASLPATSLTQVVQGSLKADAELVEDEEMSDQDDEDLSSSDEASDSSPTSPEDNEGIHLDDAESVSSIEGSEALEFNPDPDCLVTLPPHLEAEAVQRAILISAQYEQEVVAPQMMKAAADRLEAVQKGQLPPDVAAHDDELAQMGLDPEEVRDTSMVAEYSKEIFAYMARCEMETLANPQYITYQNELHWHMRTTLVDWLLQVHTRYHMLPETLFIAINIVDRFLSVRVVSLAKLQLVGVTAMFIAAKYEEIVAPSVDEFVFMTEGGYSKDEIFKGERIVLQTLDFKVSSYCSPYSWVRRISKADDYDIQVRTLAKFLMEMTLLDHRFLRAKPSLIAAISMFLSKKMLGGHWDEGFVYYSGFCEEQLIPGANLLLEKLAEPAFADVFVCKKYEHRRFLRASMYARDWALRNWPGAQAPVAANGEA